jgi:hypothetical protein
MTSTRSPSPGPLGSTRGTRLTLAGVTLAGVTLAGAAGCQSVAGFDDFVHGAKGGAGGTGAKGAGGGGLSGSGGGGAGGTAGSGLGAGGAADCVSSGAVCAPTAPAGWEGPAFVPTTASCPPDTVEMFTLGTDASATTFCDCEPIGACPAASIKMYTVTACDSGGATVTATPNVCAGLPGSFSSFEVVPPGAGGPTSCAAVAPVPDYVAPRHLCAFADPPPGCAAGEVCTPGAGCVWRAGDFDCPAGFGDPVLLSSPSIVCSECPLPSPCIGTVDVFSSDDCAVPLLTSKKSDEADCVGVGAPNGLSARFLVDPCQGAVSAAIQLTTYTLCCPG